jgi:dTDP-4-dehydrorhamnose reductase
VKEKEMKVVIFGASGIIGQHLRLCVPEGIESVWVRKEADPLHLGLDLTDPDARERFLAWQKPDVIVNLAGESRPDVVEREPETYRHINFGIPSLLSAWCAGNNAHYVHISSQAVFSGEEAPQEASTRTGRQVGPVNYYGQQKMLAEHAVMRPECTIVRPTFVLGVRPLPFVGRENPVEQMLSQAVQRQVGDRWFSVSFARDVAVELWQIVKERPRGEIRHIGIPFRVNRWELANHLTAGVERVAHEDFPGLAPRPIDTTYAGQGSWAQVTQGLAVCQQDFVARKGLTLEARARELALFMGKREDECLTHLNRGFHPIHQEVTDDFNTFQPADQEDLLYWYRSTEEYLWELSFYHADRGFNYSGMCQGIAERLKAAGMKRILCLGDGIGDLTLSLIRAGFDAVYHDLTGSRTAEFAQFRFWMHLGRYAPTAMGTNWTPNLGRGEYDAVISLDFLEHIPADPGVPAWTAAIRDAIVPGGLMLVQNAFNIGSGPQGSMPMHLSCNDRFEKDWTPLMVEQGFEQEGTSNWYRTPSVSRDLDKIDAILAESEKQAA